MPGTQKDYHTRQTQILDGALVAAESKGYRQITQKDIATEADMSTGSITYHFDNMDNLRDQLMYHAILRGNLDVLAQGLVAKDPIALAAPETAKANALALLSNA